MSHSLTLGTLLLTDDFPDADHGFRFDILADGMSFGVAQGVREVIVSLLADGDLVRTTRYGNREVTFDVEITGPTLGALAQGEAALRRELGRPSTLTWQAPDILSVPTVFEVVDSEMSQTFNDLAELRIKRTFRVTLTCAPFARSLNVTTAGALGLGAGAPSVIDTCDSATGWTADIDGITETVSTGWDAGSVGVLVFTNPDNDADTLTMTRTGAVDFTGTPYLVVEKKNFNSATENLIALADGVELQVIATTMVGSDRIRYTFLVPDLSVTSLAFKHSRQSGVILGMLIFELSKSNLPPGATARQVTRILEVGGTERTPGSLAVASSNGVESLGMTVVHTSPEDGSGYSPALRRWRVSGGAVTTDAATMSGGREPMVVANPFIAEIPNKALPEGGYLLAARLRRSVVGPTVVNWAAETRVDGVGDGYVTDYSTVTFPSSGNWFFVPVAVLTLPTVRSNGGNVQILMSSGADVEIDEAWVFRVDDDCALTVIHNAVKPRLWLDSPDATSPVPRIWIGDEEDRSDAAHPGGNLYCHGNHTFTPDAMSVFVGTSGTEYPNITLTHHARWHSNAAS